MSSVKSEVEQLKAEKTLLIEALIYYADPANYTRTDNYMFYRTLSRDDVTTKPERGFYSAGKRARATLKKFGIIM